MLLNYNECLEIYKTHYNLSKAMDDKKIFKLSNGLYSTIESPKELDIFIKIHSNIIFTLESAFYYLGISDYIPEKYVIATNKNSTKYNNKSITQYYFDLNILNIGKTNFNYNGSIIPIYNKERLLIELIRYKNKLPYDYYKEIINYYRKNLEQIDMSLVLDYLSAFPKENKILRTIQTEVI